MDFTVQQQRLAQLMDRVNLTGIFVLGLFMSNFLIGGLAWYLTYHQKIEITPFSGAEGYHKSDASIDNHYLSMMTENFIYSRLNVTPETVRASHKRLLSFVDITYYPKFLDILNKEARVVTHKKTASYFEIKNIQLDEKNLRATVTGKLKRAIGSRAFHEERATYHLQYAYHLGRLSVTQFTRSDLQESAIPM
ncbi:MAG: type IV conjugative transfer system protein TraE [Gammaproteobacteria bacterium]|nr:type IV conjugative transfer system protein TraE [Gammaproteobacteria bacterium]